MNTFKITMILDLYVLWLFYLYVQYYVVNKSVYYILNLQIFENSFVI